MAKLKNLVPKLSPQDMRLLKRVFLDHANDQGKLIEELEKFSTIIKESQRDNLHLGKDYIKISKNYLENQISFETCCLLFIDLLKAGWSIDVGIKGFLLGLPSYNTKETGETLDEIKSRMRNVQLVNRDKQIKDHETQKFIERMQRPRKVGYETKSVLDLIDDGAELSEYFKEINSLDDERLSSILEKIIKPEIVICYPEDPYYQEEEHYCPYTSLKLKDIWRYFRLTWSSEYKSIPGKSVPILIRNAARPNKPIIGIAQLRSAALADTARDTKIGWVNEEILTRKIYSKEIDIKFVVDCLLSSLEEEINAINIDDIDFLNKNVLKEPTQEVIDKLNLIYEEQKIQREEDLADENIMVTRIKTGRGDTDWQSESELPIFKKKRATKLARLLEARKIFNEVNLSSNPAIGYATLIVPGCKKNGKDMISRVLREIRTKALAENIMDLSVCGAVAPYSEILGGKLVASLMGSQELRELFRLRYHSKYKSPSIIASSNKGKPVYRDANLLCITTTSLYGVASSQYNRIKFLKKNYNNLEQDLVWQEVMKGSESHKTKGLGVYHISDRTINLMNIFSYKKLGRKEVNSKFGEGTSPKLRKIAGSLNLLFDFISYETNHEDILAHSIQRKNYICFLVDDILKILLKQKKNYTGIKLSSSKSISNAWIKRWLLPRIKRQDTLIKLKELNSSTVKNNLYFPEILEIKSLDSQILLFPNNNNL